MPFMRVNSWAVDNYMKGWDGFMLSNSSFLASILKSAFKENKIIGKTASVFEGALAGIRNYNQYSLYSRTDDDVYVDKKQNPFAFKLGKIACFTERYIDPWFLTLSKLFRDDDAIETLAHLPRDLYWRSRVFVDNPFYRTLGYIGFFSVAFLSTTRSILKLSGLENRFINFLAGVGFAVHHIIYFLKFTKPAENIKLKTLGVVTNGLNLGLPAISVLPVNSSFKNILCDAAKALTMCFFSFRRYLHGEKALMSQSTPQ